MSDILNTLIGSGAGWPIELNDSLDEQGKPIIEKTLDDGTIVYKKGWYAIEGDMKLIEQNISTIIDTTIGFMIRDETFGTRLCEVFEEPNSQASAFLVKKYIKDAIIKYETRINIISIESNIFQETLQIVLNYGLNDTEINRTLSIDYTL